MKKKSLVILLFLLLIPFVTAQIAVDDDVVKNVLTPEDFFAFKLFLIL